MKSSSMPTSTPKRPEEDRATHFEATSSETGCVLPLADRILPVVEKSIRAQVPVRGPRDVAEIEIWSAQNNLGTTQAFRRKGTGDGKRSRTAAPRVALNSASRWRRCSSTQRNTRGSLPRKSSMTMNGLQWKFSVQMILETEVLDHEERADGPITHRRPTGRRPSHSSTIIRSGRTGGN